MGTVAPLGFKVSELLTRVNEVNRYDFVMLNGDIAYAGVNSE